MRMPPTHSPGRAAGATALAFAVLLVLVCAGPARAARLRLHVPNPAVEVGMEGAAFIELMPDPGEQVRGAWVSLTVNPEFIMLLSDRKDYASDPVFSKVEKFTVDAMGGALVYRVQTDQPVTGNKILLRVPLKYMQVGLSSITFTASVYNEALERTPVNSGYQRVAGYKGELDPMLLSSLLGGNDTLADATMTQDVEFIRAQGQSSAVMDAGLGITALEEADTDEDADVVVEFSKRETTIGLRQWVRLDVVVTKFPNSELLAAAAFKVKYDPQFFSFTNSIGQEAEKVDLNKVFNFGFVNRVDRVQGTIDVQVALDISMEDTSVVEQMPVTIVSLYFKGMRESTGQSIQFEEVKVPVTRTGSKLAKHNAVVNVSATEKGCDKDLPASLCSGSFKVSGDVTFSISNKNEVQRTAAVGNWVSNTEQFETGTSETVRVKKFFLEQTWNLNMNGSLKNGVRMQGSLVDNPNMEQSLNMEMIGQDTKARFGDFNSSMTDSKLVSLSSSEVTGLHVEHLYKGLSFRGLLAELKSSPDYDSISGIGNNGPYTFAAGARIIPASVGVFKNDELLTSDQYTIDFARNQINFTEALKSTDRLIIKFQKSSLLFSTGNIRAFRLNYQTGNENFQVGSTYITTMSPKSTSQIRIATTEKVDKTKVLPQEGAPPNNAFVCGHFGDNPCYEIKLDHEYVVKDTLEITNLVASDKNTYTADSRYVHLDHRSLREGRFFVDASRFLDVNLEVSYTYYNPAFITQRAFEFFRVNFSDTIYTAGRWPTDMFPGSEILYLSTDEDYDITEGADEIVCFKQILSNGAEDKDNPLFCPGNSSPSQHDYRLEGSDIDTIIKFSQGAPQQPVLKVLYTPVPSDVAGGSEFEKVAWGVDTSLKIGKRFTVLAEYAQANSDLSASFNTTEDDVFVDVFTGNVSGESNGFNGTCLFNAQEATLADDTLTCSLSNSGLFGSVIIKFQRCLTYVGNDHNCTSYDINAQDIIVPLTGINKEQGTLTFRRDTWAQTNNSAPFPNEGDKFFVTYTYDQTLDQVVTGDAYYIDSNYAGKNLKFNVTKRVRDPLFDSAVSQFKDNTVDQLKGDVSLTIKNKWTLAYNWRDGTEETLNIDGSGKLASTYERKADSLSLSYRSGNLTGLKYQRDSTSNAGFALGVNDVKSVTDDQADKEALSFALSMRKNVFSLTGAISRDRNSYNVGTKTDTQTMSSLYTLKYAPSPKLNFSVGLNDSHADPLGTKNDSLSYNLTLRALPWVDVTLGLTDSKNRSGYNTEYTQNQNTQYSLQFVPIWKVQNLNVTFNRADTPGGTNQKPNRTRSDNLTLGFMSKFKNVITFKPSYNRTVNSTDTQSYDYSRGMQWNLEYKPVRSKFNPVVTYQRSRSSSLNRSFSAGIQETTTFSKSSEMGVNFDASKKVAVTTRLKRSAGSLSPMRSLNFTLRYKWFENMTVNTGFSINRTLGLSPTRSNARSLDFNWRLSDVTSLALKYSRSNTTTGGSSASLPVTTFSTEIKTQFK